MSLPSSLDGALQSLRAFSAIVESSNANTPDKACMDEAELQAVILFPALGTPYVAPASEKTIKLYLIAEAKCTTLFRINPADHTAPLAWYFLNKHLRLLPFSEAHKTSTDLNGTRLYGSTGAAQAGIKVWYRGTYQHGTGLSNRHWGRQLYDHQGQMVATLRQSAVDFFVNASAAYGPIAPACMLPAAKADVRNQPLEHLFEIELSTQGLRVPPQPGQVYTLAWMVTNVYRQATSPNGKPVFAGVTEWEHQDKLIYDFLWMMKEKQHHFWEPFTFNVPAIAHDKLSDQLRQETSRLKAYHPVLFSNKPALHIGHLSDVHISSRHFALARSEAQAIPGVSDPIGPKLTNSFMALRELFDSMRGQGADAIFLTGDLLDFNQNFNPLALAGGAAKDQWAQYDLSKQFRNGQAVNPQLYPRGLDDMLAYSLIKYSYLHGCPVFMTTGNHEAYDVPYGIAPRLNDYAKAQTIQQTLGVDAHHQRAQQLLAQADEREKAGDTAGAAALREQARELEADTPVIPQRIHEVTEWAEHKATEAAGKSCMPGVLDLLGPPASGVLNTAGCVASKGLAAKWQAAKHPEPSTADDSSDPAYAYSDFRLNEGIPADHNLTIYEACMAYGPAYGQVLKSWNFTPANYDWFFMLFTPLADYVVRYGQSQCLIGLDWGETEIMINADMNSAEVKAAAAQAGHDTGPWPLDPAVELGAVVGETLKASYDQVFGLPRADKSISDGQQTLMQGGLRDAPAARKNVLFTHFTLINYEGSVPLQGQRQFVLQDGTFNHYNRGTFGLKRRWLFELFNDGSSDGRLHYTLAGHSHRAAAYSMNWADDQRQVAAVQGYEPALPGAADQESVHRELFNGSKTRILVSSCGGPIGGQSYRGELEGRNLTAPSGTLLKTDAQGCDEFRRIVAKQRTAQPRFCVALDYLTVERKKAVVTWGETSPGLPPGMHFMHVGHVMKAEPFVEKVEFFVWHKDQIKGGNGAYLSFSTSLKRLASQDTINAKDAHDTPTFGYAMTIDDLAGLIAAINGSGQAAPMFCRIHFNGALNSHPLYGHYNFDDPWCFPVSIAARGPGVVGGPGYIHRIARPKGEFGEVPDFRSLGQILKSDYHYSALYR